MTEDAELARALSALAPKRGLIPSDRAAHTAPDTPGLYAIYIDSDDNLPPLFAAELRRRNRRLRNHDLLHQDLLYIGFGKDLRKRLVEEDLRGGTSTFFRGIGSVLDYMPPPGSLRGKKNQYNYRFSRDDRARIVEWINLHLLVCWRETERAGAIERDLIEKMQPLLNTRNNPEPFEPLAHLRDKCRAIARG